jgi:NADPH:quinone reductase-like Zn-dependent oxidoreductase
VRELGATQTIDYSAGNVAETVRQMYPDGVTALIDTVSQRGALSDLGSVVRSGGRVATSLGAADVEHFSSRGVAAMNVNAAPTADKLLNLANLASSGELSVTIQAVYPLDQVEDALAAFQQGTQGKIVLSVAPAEI